MSYWLLFPTLNADFQISSNESTFLDWKIYVCLLNVGFPKQANMVGTCALIQLLFQDLFVRLLNNRKNVQFLIDVRVNSCAEQKQ